jgi:hypothetical protein
MLTVKQPNGEVFIFSDVDDEFSDFIVETLRSEGAGNNFISYVKSEVEDLSAGDNYTVEFAGNVICTCFLEETECNDCDHAYLNEGTYFCENPDSPVHQDSYNYCVHGRYACKEFKKRAAAQ